MTLKDREYQRMHRSDREAPLDSPKSSKFWFWVVVVMIAALAMLRLFWPHP